MKVMKQATSKKKSLEMRIRPQMQQTRPDKTKMWLQNCSLSTEPISCHCQFHFFQMVVFG